MLRNLRKDLLGGSALAVMIMLSMPTTASAFNWSWSGWGESVVEWFAPKIRDDVAARFSKINSDEGLKFISDTIDALEAEGASKYEVRRFLALLEYQVDRINFKGDIVGNFYNSAFVEGFAFGPAVGVLVFVTAVVIIYQDDISDAMVKAGAAIANLAKKALDASPNVDVGNTGISSANIEKLIKSLGLEAALEAIRERARGKKLFFATYIKRHEIHPDEAVYSGRTHGIGNPRTEKDVDIAVELRSENHHMNEWWYGGPEKACASYEYPAIRGHEQLLINKFGGTTSGGVWEGLPGTSGNARNEIAATHRLVDFYLNRGRSLTLQDCFHNSEYVF